MLNSKKTNILLAMAGAAALMASSPVLAQAPAEPTPAASTAAPAAAAPAAGEADPATVNDAVGGGHGDITPISMFMEATVVVKVVMAGLLLASILSWTLLLIKLFEFGALNKKTDQFLESFRGARSISDMRAVATSDEFDGNPLADMAAESIRLKPAPEERLSRIIDMNEERAAQILRRWLNNEAVSSDA